MLKKHKLTQFLRLHTRFSPAGGGGTRPLSRNSVCLHAASLAPGAESAGGGRNGEVPLPEWQSAEAGGGGAARENCTRLCTRVYASRPNAEGTSLLMSYLKRRSKAGP